MKPSEKWEERFDKNFEQDTDDNDKVSGWLRMKVGPMSVKIATPGDVKSFLASEREALLKEVMEMIESRKEAYQKAKSPYAGNFFECDFAIEALTEVQDLIKKL